MYQVFKTVFYCLLFFGILFIICLSLGHLHLFFFKYLFVDAQVIGRFVLIDTCYKLAEENLAAQRQTAVTTHLKSKQLLLFAFARQSVCYYSIAEENPAAQRQTAVTAYLKSKQLLLFAFVW